MKTFFLSSQIVLYVFIAGESLSQTSSTSLSDLALADRYFSKAEILKNEIKLDSSTYYYENALSIYENSAIRLGNPKLWEKIVQCYNSIGENCREIQDLNQALKIFNQGLEIGFEHLNAKHPDIAQTYYGLGMTHKRIGNFDNAIANFTKSREIRIDLYDGGHPDVIMTNSVIGDSYKEKGDADKAIEYWTKAIPKNLEESQLDVAIYFRNMGNISRKNGQYDEALEYHNKSLLITLDKFGENHQVVANQYLSIGTLFRLKSDYQQALEYYNKALGIRLALYGKNHVLAAKTLSAIATVYYHIDRLDDALDYYDKSLPVLVKQRGENHPIVAHHYTNVGNVYRKKGNYDKALQHYNKSLSLKLQQLGDNHPKLSSTYHNIGIVYTHLNVYDKALENLNKALELRLNTWGEVHLQVAETYGALGDLYKSKKQFDPALALYQKALIALTSDFNDSNIYVNPSLKNISSEKTFLRTLLSKANVLTDVYYHSQKLKDLKMSFFTYQLACRLINQIRSRYKATGSKLFLGTDVVQIYEKASQVALKLYNVTHENKYKEVVFSFSEKSKSNVLLEAVSEAQAKHFANLPSKLFNKEKQLKIAVESYATQIQLEHEKPNTNTAKILQFENRYFDARREYEKLIEYFEKNYPKYYELKFQTRIPSIGDVQKTLDENTLILNYLVGDSTIFIITISKNSFDVIPVSKHRDFDSIVVSFVKSIKTLGSKTFLQLSHKLYRMLIQPVEAKISTKKRLIVIPDGILLKIPFAALITDLPEISHRIDFTKMNYLIKDYEISYHYSTNLYLKILHDLRETSSNQYFVGFAPIFSDAQQSGNLFASKDVMPELKHSKTEISSIIRLIENAKGTGKAYFGTEASEENFKATASYYNYIHLATHGFINEERPKLSGLAFSPVIGSHSFEDGILYSDETYSLDLNADLVVLSSCESGIGKLMRGEGLMALTRGFLYSGARNIVVSLWKVLDKHTSELMIEFYRNIFSGKDFTQSLREAKLKMLENPETAFPKSWASFVLVGR